MQTKTLSPTTQAVLDAWSASENGVYLEGDPERLAAALRAAANQIKPHISRTPWLTNEDGYFNEVFENYEAFGELNSYFRLLTIADELENYNV